MPTKMELVGIRQQGISVRQNRHNLSENPKCRQSADCLFAPLVRTSRKRAIQNSLKHEQFFFSIFFFELRFIIEVSYNSDRRTVGPDVMETRVYANRFVVSTGTAAVGQSCLEMAIVYQHKKLFRQHTTDHNIFVSTYSLIFVPRGGLNNASVTRRSACSMPECFL